MRFIRLIALTTGLTLLLVACGGAGTESASDVDGIRVDDFELIATNDSTEPFDPNGGATSSDDGVIIDTDDPQSNLRGQVRSATSGWPTCSS